jgi:hypothetical protein
MSIFLTQAGPPPAAPALIFIAPEALDDEIDDDLDTPARRIEDDWVFAHLGLLIDEDDEPERQPDPVFGIPDDVLLRSLDGAAESEGEEEDAELEPVRWYLEIVEVAAGIYIPVWRPRRR